MKRTPNARIGSLALLGASLLPAAASAQQTRWVTMPRMQLERQYAGPLQDTIIQRWRDPADGTICYLYLPITAAHTAPTPSGYVQYGANSIGSLSCLPEPPGVRQTPHARNDRLPRAKPK